MTAQQSSDSVRCHMLEDSAPNNQPKILPCFTWKTQNRGTAEELKSWAERSTQV